MCLPPHLFLQFTGRGGNIEARPSSRRSVHHLKTFFGAKVVFGGRLSFGWNYFGRQKVAIGSWYILTYTYWWWWFDENFMSQIRKRTRYRNRKKKRLRICSAVWLDGGLLHDWRQCLQWLHIFNSVISNGSLQHFESLNDANTSNLNVNNSNIKLRWVLLYLAAWGLNGALSA